MLESEEMLVRSKKDYRLSVKSRLKEMIEDGDEDAQKEYSRLFPAPVFKEAREVGSYQSRVLGRQNEMIPYICCKTCGKMSDKVLEFKDPDLRKEKRKTWRRVIKPDLKAGYVFINNKKLRQRRIFFAYDMLKCVGNRHKLQVVFKNKKSQYEMGYSYK